MDVSRIGIVRPLRLREFRLLWIGTTVSLVGDGIFLVALAWEVFELTHSAASLALVGVAQTLPLVLLLLGAGVLADRVDRRYLMVAGDLLRLGAVGGMAAMVFTGTISMPRIVALAALVGIGQALYMPAFSSIVPLIVPEDLLVEANSLGALIRPIAILVGPFIGGVIVGVAGIGWAFAADAFSFAWSAAMILGRVSSIDWLVVLAGAPLSFALIGPLVNAMGARTTLVVTGVLGALALVAPLFVRGALDPEHDGSFAEPILTAEPLGR